jgi:YhcG PDDEXK nuclease domain
LINILFVNLFNLYNSERIAFRIDILALLFGILLCSEKNEAVVKYSVLSDSQQIFASKYVLYLPTEMELKEELERERHFAELKMKNEKQG